MMGFRTCATEAIFVVMKAGALPAGENSGVCNAEFSTFDIGKDAKR